MSTIPNWLVKRAYLSPNRTAIIFEDREYTFKELFDYSYTLAKKISSFGVKNGDRVAVLLNNHIEMVFVIHALQMLGCPAIMLNIRLTEAEIQYQIEDSEATFLITEKDLYSKVKDLYCPSLKGKRLMSEIWDEKETSFDIVENFSLDDICTIMYTSGTTGFPKGVLQSYGNHWWSAIGSALNLGLHQDDVWISAVPLFHISGFSIIVRSVIYGMPIRLYSRFDEKMINDDLINGRGTIISVVSTMLLRLVANLGNRTYSSKFRCMLTGGGPVPMTLLNRCLEKSIPVFQSYGMTETSSQIVTLSPEDSLTKIGSAGKPLFPSQVEIRIDNELAQPNQVGDIFVKGPNVTRGYLKRPDVNARDFSEDGWFKTGDVGYLDEEGYLFVLDRRSDLIISGGENIYPAEIENIILSHPKISEAAVIGIQDETWGQVPCGFYVLKSGETITDDELTQYCLKILAKYKVPKKWIEIDQIPKNASNKILRRELRNLVE